MNRKSWSLSFPFSKKNCTWVGHLNIILEPGVGIWRTSFQEFNLHGRGKLEFRIDRHVSMKFVSVPAVAHSNWISLLKEASTTFKPQKWGFVSRVHPKGDMHLLDCMVCLKLSSANLEKPLLTNIILEHSLYAKNWKIKWSKKGN